MNLLDYIRNMGLPAPATLVFERTGYQSILVYIENPENHFLKNISDLFAKFLEYQQAPSGAVIIPDTCDPCNDAMVNVCRKAEKAGGISLLNTKYFTETQKIF